MGNHLTRGASSEYYQLGLLFSASTSAAYSLIRNFSRLRIHLPGIEIRTKKRWKHHDLCMPVTPVQISLSRIPSHGTENTTSALSRSKTLQTRWGRDVNNSTEAGTIQWSFPTASYPCAPSLARYRIHSIFHRGQLESTFADMAGLTCRKLHLQHNSNLLTGDLRRRIVIENIYNKHAVPPLTLTTRPNDQASDFLNSEPTIVEMIAPRSQPRFLPESH